LSAVDQSAASETGERITTPRCGTVIIPVAQSIRVQLREAGCKNLKDGKSAATPNTPLVGAGRPTKFKMPYGLGGIYLLAQNRYCVDKSRDQDPLATLSRLFGLESWDVGRDRDVIDVLQCPRDDTEPAQKLPKI
jgi:hypothetical protein